MKRTRSASSRCAAHVQSVQATIVKWPELPRKAQIDRFTFASRGVRQGKAKGGFRDEDRRRALQRNDDAYSGLPVGMPLAGCRVV